MPHFHINGAYNSKLSEVYSASLKGTCWGRFALLAIFSNIENIQQDSFRENVHQSVHASVMG